MLGKYLENVREKSPLIHNITNYVTVTDVANMVLACGASPIMADDVKDVEDITAICGGLNINIGTLNYRTVEAMMLAGEISNRMGHPVLLDPVGAGASRMRTATAQAIAEKIKLTVIRGNISEIKALVGGRGSTKGVDADIADAVTEENLEDMAVFIKSAAKKYSCVVACTGAIDLVADSERCFVIRNGRPEMSKITGTGCQLSAMTTAFVTASPENVTEAAAAAVRAMGLAGEIGYSHLGPYEGNSTYRNRIIDAVYNMTGEELDRGAKYEIL